MNIAELRNFPFILLVLKDGESNDYFSPEFMHKTKQQLSDMSLRIASDNLSIIYADQIKKGCEIVLGMCNLGLLSLCDNDTDKAKDIIKTQGIVYCFRAGWGKYAELKKVSPSYFESVSLNNYALGMNDTADIRLIHEKFMAEGYQSAMLLNIYKSLAAKYSANTVLIDNDEDVLLYELQKFLNTAIALLMIDSEKKAFTSSSYQQLNTFLTDTKKEPLMVKMNSCISSFITTLPVITKDYLQSVNLLDFKELKDLINENEKNNISIYIQEILELPITVSNELNDDFEGGYDFHIDDDEDLAYLMPDSK